MPAVSEKQKKFMQAVAHNKAFAKKVGVPQKVGKEFAMKKYAKGGISEYGGMEKYASKAAMKKHEAKETPMEEKLEKKMGKNMARATMQKVASGEVKKHESRMHGAKKMARGGGVEVRGKTKGTMVKMAKGGLASGHKQADGVAKKGKTKGTEIKMRKGGMCK